MRHRLPFLPRSRERRQAYNRRVIVLLLFFGSGLASLGLESVYRRELSLLVGSEVTATSLTLATFLGGLALGAAIFGRTADRSARPLRLYGLMELGVGVTGAAAVSLLALGREALLAPVRAFGAGAAGSAIAIAIAAVLLLPATILMGGTLPALTRHVLDNEDRFLGALATLYGVNTLGAAFGAALTGFVLFELVGIATSGWLCAGLAATVGAVAVALEARSVDGMPPSAENRQADGPVAATTARRRVALLVAGLGGAAALGYEVVWTRLLVLPLRSYAYSFSLMLSLFLVGLVVGALLLARVERHISDPLRTLAAAQLASGAYVAASVVWVPALLTGPAEGSGFVAFLWSGLLRAGPVVLPPTILSGMALPLAIRAAAGSAWAAGRAVGTVYAVNTIGAIGGALGSGLLLLPWLGASGSLALLATVAAAAGSVAGGVAWTRGAGRWAGIVVAAACALVVALPAPGFARAYAHAGRSSGDDPKTLFYREGATDTVAVVRRDYGFRDADAKSVIVNGIAMTATVKPVWRYMAAEGHLPALFAPDPSRGLVICVGTGITLGALASHESVSAIDAVDLSESILAALPVFERENRAVVRDPKISLVHADGRHLLELTGRRYGLITLEPPPPIVAGSVHLYTLDFYRLCRSRLEPGGVVAQWLPLHAQSLASARATARTFLEAFPHVQLWLPSVRDAVLIGSERPLRLDPERLRAAYAAPATHASLEAAYFESPEALLATFLLDRDGVARWAAGADLITDDRPRIEFFRRYGGTMSDREIASLLSQPLGDLGEILGDDADPAFRSAVAAERRAHLLYVRADIDKDPVRSRAAALASRATRFGLYRLGCDQPQLDALRAEGGGDASWQRQVQLCRDWVEGSTRSD
jgi:spermidine synthase